MAEIRLRGFPFVPAWLVGSHRPALNHSGVICHLKFALIMSIRESADPHGDRGVATPRKAGHSLNRVITAAGLGKSIYTQSKPTVLSHHNKNLHHAIPSALVLVLASFSSLPALAGVSHDFHITHRLRPRLSNLQFLPLSQHPRNRIRMSPDTIRLPPRSLRCDLQLACVSCVSRGLR